MPASPSKSTSGPPAPPPQYPSSALPYALPSNAKAPPQVRNPSDEPSRVLREACHEGNSERGTVARLICGKIWQAGGRCSGKGRPAVSAMPNGNDCSKEKAPLCWWNWKEVTKAPQGARHSIENASIVSRVPLTCCVDSQERRKSSPFPGECQLPLQNSLGPSLLSNQVLQLDSRPS